MRHSQLLACVKWYMCFIDSLMVQDQMVLEMRDMIKALQTDCRSLAAAVTQMSTGVEMSSVLQSLPPTLVQVSVLLLLLYYQP